MNCVVVVDLDAEEHRLEYSSLVLTAIFEPVFWLAIRGNVVVAFDT